MRGTLFGYEGSVETYQEDGRLKLEELYQAYAPLPKNGWGVDLLCWQELVKNSQRVKLPIIALRSPKKGPATGIIAGIHGDESAGVMALALSVGKLISLGVSRSLVIVPLASPLSYAENTYYPYHGRSVGDCSHFAGLRKEPACSEVVALTDFFSRYRESYPLGRALDLHEYSPEKWLINGNSFPPKNGLFLYGHGEERSFLPPARGILQKLAEMGEEILWEGETKEGEKIKGGIVRDPIDYSLDWWLAKIYGVPGGVLVLETPLAFPLEKRAATARRVLEIFLES